MNHQQQRWLAAKLLAKLSMEVMGNVYDKHVSLEDDLESNVVLLKDHIKMALEQLPNYSEEYEQ